MCDTLVYCHAGDPTSIPGGGTHTSCPHICHIHMKFHLLSYWAHNSIQFQVASIRYRFSSALIPPSLFNCARTPFTFQLRSYHHHFSTALILRSYCVYTPVTFQLHSYPYRFSTAVITVSLSTALISPSLFNCAHIALIPILLFANYTKYSHRLRS